MEQPRERQIALQIGGRACATTCRKTRVIPWLADSCKRDFVARSNVPVCMFHVLTIRSRLRCYLTAPPLWLLPRPSGHESGFNAMISPREWSFAGIDLKTAHGSAPNRDNRDVCSSVRHYTYNFVPVAHVRWWTCPSKPISLSSHASFHDHGYPLSSFIHTLYGFLRASIFFPKWFDNNASICLLLGKFAFLSVFRYQIYHPSIDVIKS